MIRTSSVEIATRFFMLRCFGGNAGGNRLPVETNLVLGGRVGTRDSWGKSSTDKRLSMLLPSRLDLRFSHSRIRDFSCKWIRVKN